ncbi:MAG: glycosyltransferase family A protein [Bradyrhizobium sp.]|uniref:glycosyltransferase family 2 protein n=1 Tax=Bradyrhizobium sp. TaxID=376 RepID=UPI00273147D8|nr:glycosyltransferase family A protein [Bradyrhizobium sp.]MDP1867432.1 glycosyltransferase family A protein [Bradyrhizobium sp.]
MPSPRVTVIIPTYNRSAVLRYAISSVLAQTMPEFELIVVGDACTDDSEQVVKAISDPRVKWINLPVNVGHQAGPNNRGLQEARGEFIAYLGHDDLWLGHHLQCTIDALKRTGADVAHSLLMSVSPGEVVGLPVMPLPGVGSAPSCSVYRRSVTDAIGGWRDYRELDLAPESDLFRRAEAAGFKTLFVPRLSAIKFPALHRKDVYRDRPSHEQELWLDRMRSTPDFEPTLLARMIASDQAVRALPARKLIRILVQEIRERLAWRLARRSGHRAIFWTTKGAGIDLQKRYKGLK